MHEVSPQWNGQLALSSSEMNTCNLSGLKAVKTMDQCSPAENKPVCENSANFWALSFLAKLSVMAFYHPALQNHSLCHLWKWITVTVDHGEQLGWIPSDLAFKKWHQWSEMTTKDKKILTTMSKPSKFRLWTCIPPLNLMLRFYQMTSHFLNKECDTIQQKTNRDGH